MKKVLAVSLFVGQLCVFGVAEAAHLYPERYYQEEWCGKQGGQVEVVLADQARVDCVTATHAIEFDFGKKWAEA